MFAGSNKRLFPAVMDWTTGKARHTPQQPYHPYASSWDADGQNVYQELALTAQWLLIPAIALVLGKTCRRCVIPLHFLCDCKSDSGARLVSGAVPFWTIVKCALC